MISHQIGCVDVAKEIANTDKEVNEKYKYVGILSDESSILNYNKRKSHLKSNDK